MVRPIGTQRKAPGPPASKRRWKEADHDRHTHPARRGKAGREPRAKAVPQDAGCDLRDLGRFLLLGLAIFAVTRGPSRGELRQAYWEQVVDYYSEQYQMMAGARSEAQAAHWQAVINHYAQQYELIANASRQPAAQAVVNPVARQEELLANASRQPAAQDEAAHWQAVVNYYEQQWEMRTR